MARVVPLFLALLIAQASVCSCSSSRHGSFLASLRSQHPARSSASSEQEGRREGATAQQRRLLAAAQAGAAVLSSGAAAEPLDPGQAGHGSHLSKDQLQRVVWAMSQAERAGQVWAALTNFSLQATGTKPAGAAAPAQTSPRSSSTNGNMMRVVNCVNRAWVPKNQTWESAMKDDLASVRVAGAWWTAKQRRVPLTVVTQSTVDRIPQLFAQCKSWRGPTSVVLYRALVEDVVRPDHKLSPQNEEILRYDILQVSGFFAEVERDSEACMPDILFVYEVFTERQATLLYPINLLRNLARLQARTPMLALVDVDMLLSRHLYVDLLSQATQQHMMQTVQAKSVYVLPAFETYGVPQEASAVADMLASQDKEMLIKAVDKGLAGPFDSKRFILGHNCTNFAKWYRSAGDYKITYGERYEPWVVADRHNVPWHDVRFRGYGNNKIQQIAHINASGFQFVVHHNAFIIHRAHRETVMRQRLITSKQAFDTAKARNQPVDRTSIYGHTRTLFDAAKELMNVGKFQATLDPATQACLGALPWWRPNATGLRRRERMAAARSLQHGRREGASMHVMHAAALSSTATEQGAVAAAGAAVQQQPRQASAEATAAAAAAVTVAATSASTVSVSGQGTQFVVTVVAQQQQQAVSNPSATASSASQQQGSGQSSVATSTAAA